MKAKALLTTLLCGILAGPAIAQSEEKPVIQTEIESVRLRVQNDGENAYFQFSEAVVLTATNMRVECDSLEVFATREAEEQSNIGKFSAIKEIIASGNVRIVQDERTATCQKAIVQPNEQRIVLTGNPVVEQPGGRIVTFNPEDEIILDRGNGRITINTIGPRKLRLTSSSISDLGFEQQGPVPIPEVLAEEAAAEAEAKPQDAESAEDGDESASPAQPESDAK